MDNYTILFSRPKKFSLFSFGVRVWQGWSDESHVAMLTQDQITKVDLVYESSYGYVHAIPYETWKERNIETFKIPFSLGSIKGPKALRYIHKQLGKWYGFLTIAKLVLRSVFKMKIKGDGEHSFTCSEFVARAMGIHISNQEFIEPGQLLSYLRGEK